MFERELSQKKKKKKKEGINATISNSRLSDSLKELIGSFGPESREEKGRRKKGEKKKKGGGSSRLAKHCDRRPTIP